MMMRLSLLFFFFASLHVVQSREIIRSSSKLLNAVNSPNREYFGEKNRRGGWGTGGHVVFPIEPTFPENSENDKVKTKNQAQITPPTQAKQGANKGEKPLEMTSGVDGEGKTTGKTDCFQRPVKNTNVETTYCETAPGSNIFYEQGMKEDSKMLCMKLPRKGNWIKMCWKNIKECFMDSSLIEGKETKVCERKTRTGTFWQKGARSSSTTLKCKRSRRNGKNIRVCWEPDVDCVKVKPTGYGKEITLCESIPRSGIYDNQKGFKNHDLAGKPVCASTRQKCIRKKRGYRYIKVCWWPLECTVIG